MTKPIREKEPPVKVTHIGCATCGPRPALFGLDDVISVGFGFAALLRDSEVVYSESEGDPMTGAQAEEMAAADPNHDWRILLDGPLSSYTYQRHGKRKWVLIENGKGFA